MNPEHAHAQHNTSLLTSEGSAVLQQFVESSLESIDNAPAKIPLEYEDNPLDLNDEARLIARIGILTSDTAEVFSDIASTLEGLQHGLSFVLSKKDKKYINKHIAEVGETRKTLTEISFNPDTVRRVWVDLLNAPTPEPEPEPEKSPNEQEVPEDQKGSDIPEVIYEPTPDDVLAIVETRLKHRVDIAKKRWTQIETRFTPLIELGNEYDGLSSADIAMITGRIRFMQDLYKLPESIRGSTNMPAYEMPTKSTRFRP